MLQLAVLILLTVFLFIASKRILDKKFAAEITRYESLRQRYDKALQDDSELKKDDSQLEDSLEETIALYDVIKDIRKILDEDKMFGFFKEHLKKSIKADEYLFLEAGTDLSNYKGYSILPMVIEKDIMGYLAANNLTNSDVEKFHILGQQFQAGYRGAVLFKKVQELTITDSLTQVFNRRYFLERLDEEVGRSKRFNLRLSFLMVDIDHFKGFNDNYGHLVGDAILREVTKTIKENIRQIDFLGRYGGEELSVVLVETDKEAASLVAERIRQAIELKQIKVYDEDLKVTISIGLSTLPEDALEARAIIDTADQALYQAKEKGRNRICIYGERK